MGMAASQARLLMITSRLHDVELKAQQLQNAKLQLSTQQDEAYEEYQKALDATTFTANFIDTVTGANSADIPVTFSNLFSLDAATSNLQTGSNYILIDNNGRVVVDDDVYEGYQNYQDITHTDGRHEMNNAYAFAYYMVEGERTGHDAFNINGCTDLMEAIREVYSGVSDMETLEDNAIAALRESGVIGNYLDGDAANILTWSYSQYNHSNLNDEQRNAIETFVNYFWSHYGSQVFNKVNENSGTNIDGDSYDYQTFNYYVRLYNAIQQHGGCIAISDYDGANGSAANNNEWLTNMLQSGQMTIETVSIDNNGNATLSGTTVASDSHLAYSATTSIDKTVLAKAEAEYEHTLKVIDRKEQKIDRELNKIETERSALTKQYESIKKVSDENIDRTFGIFG